MAVMTLSEYKKKKKNEQQEQPRSSVMTLDEYKKTTNYEPEIDGALFTNKETIGMAPSGTSKFNTLPKKSTNGTNNFNKIQQTKLPINNEFQNPLLQRNKKVTSPSEFQNQLREQNGMWNNKFQQKRKEEQEKKEARIKVLEKKLPDLQNKLNTSVYSAEKKKQWQTEYNKLQKEYNNLTKDNSIDLVKTAHNGLIELGKGVVDFSEGLMDSYLQFSTSKANPYYWFNPGQLKEHQNLAKEIIKRDASQEFIDNTLGYKKKLANGKTIQETLDENSLIKSDNIGGKIFRSTGRQLPSIILSGNAPSQKFGENMALATMGVDSYGSGVEEAYQNGATRNQANAYGVANAGIEMGTEKMTGGVKFFGKGSLDDVAEKGFDKIKNPLARKFLKEVYDVSGEGGEEVVSAYLNPYAKKMTYAKDKSIKELRKEEGSYGENFLMGAGGALLMKGLQAPSNVRMNNKSNIQNSSGTTNVQQNNIEETELPVLKKNDNINKNIIEENDTQINEKNTDIQELPVREVNNIQNQETLQNKAQNKQIAPARIDINQENVVNENTTTQNETQLLEKLKEIREQTTNKKEQIKLDTHIQQIENDVKNLSDNSNTFAQDNKTIGDNNSIPLEQRVTGDELLDAKDLIEEIKSVGAKVDNNGYVTLYHQTTPENAQKIKDTGKMISNEQDIFFSTSENASQADGRGTEKLEFKIPAEKLLLDDIFSDNADVKVPLKGQKELDVTNYIVNNSSNNSFKEQQMNIINKTNPMQDDYHTGIRSVDDIKSFEEAFFEDGEYSGMDPDFTETMAKQSLQDGKITVYSSYPIENGVFVSPSKMEAQQYAGGDANKLYSKEININDVAWIDGAEGQYAKVQSNIPIKQTKGNIPIKEELLNKYNNVKEIFENQRNNYDGNVEVNTNISNVLQQYDLNNITSSKKAAITVFNMFHDNNIFTNDGNKIEVSKEGIRESIQKIFETKEQRDLIKEHMQVFSDLGDIIEHADLISQSNNNKLDTRPGVNSWNYYFDGLNINGKKYNLEFEVRSMNNGSNQYRVQRLEPKEKTTNSSGVASNNTRNLPPYESVVSKDNTTTNQQKSQVASVSLNNMQQKNKVDTKLPIKENKKEVKLPVKEIPKNPTKESTYDEKAYDRKKQHEKLIKQEVKAKVKGESQKAINIATKVGQKYLELDRTQKAELKEQLSKYSGKTRKQLTNSKTWNEIKDIVNNYAEKQISYVDNEIQDIKTEIKNTKIKIDDNIKSKITDYNDFRKDNFGKLKLSKDGVSLDSMYQELSEQYPYYFINATTEADMLYELSDFMNKDTNMYEKIKLDDATLERATTKIYNSLLQNTMNKDAINELKEEIQKKYNKRTRKIVQKELQDRMGITADDLQVGKDISSLEYQRTDPIRLHEKVFGYETGKKINDATINFTKHQEAERIRFLNQERNEIKDLGIKPRSKESAAVQKYGEKQYVNDYGEVKKYGDAELQAEFSDTKTQQKIKHAASVIRTKYDNYIDNINEVITEMGYDPIPKRKDYMRHFMELNDKLSQWGIPLNRESLSQDALPTDINGITDQFKPGKNWFASTMQRKGLKTTYDAITGIDGYLEGASNLMYHTESIQRYRTLSKLVRETYGQTHGMENIDLSTKEGQQRLNDIMDNKLSKYAAWLDEQANALAGKKGGIDRAAERLLGRKVYSVLDTAKKQVGSNMTGFNVRSAMTNFASAVQGAAKTNKLAFIKGTISTVKNIVHNDGLINKSDFLTSRFGSDQLSKKLWQKASNAGQIFMTGSDYFTANQIWRSKYYENLSKGMTEQQAIKNADDFSARIMGDRSKGATAEIFNSKTLGLLTQFQLEVNNQWSSIVHDNKMDIKSGNKSGATAVFQLGQLAAMSYLFNNFMKSVTGSDVMIDPIDILKQIFGDDDDKTTEEKAQAVLGDLVNDLPFVSFLTGGRIPVSEAFTGAGTFTKKITGQKDRYGNPIKWEDVKNDAISSGFYWLLPTGYGQIKKTTKGVSMYDPDLPVAGSYTKTGNLRFSADESTGGKIKAALFGQYTNDEAKKYIESGYKTIRSTKIDEMKELGMKSSEYRDYRSGLAQAGTKNEDKIDYIVNLDNVTNKQKNIMASNFLSRDFDIKEYNKYDSYEEYNYAYHNPEKYNLITQITSYDKYKKYNEELTEIRDNTKNDKEETIKYINSLNLSIPQKAMYIKTYYKSFKQYDKQIIQYINGKNLKMSEKSAILEKLGFTVRNGRVY